jgi:hypothetical protein
MHYPVRWDPFFTGYMTLADLFRYPTQHYDFHRRQLTLWNTPSLVETRFSPDAPVWTPCKPTWPVWSNGQSSPLMSQCG